MNAYSDTKEFIKTWPDIVRCNSGIVEDNCDRTGEEESMRDGGDQANWKNVIHARNNQLSE